jgi:hypothetical protein
MHPEKVADIMNHVTGVIRFSLGGKQNEVD